MAKKHGHQVGIEAKIEYHPTLDILGFKYESWRRTALNELIKKKGKRAKDIYKLLEKQLKRGFATSQAKQHFRNQLLGLKSKILKIASLQQDHQQLESSKRLHICFGERKLFNVELIKVNPAFASIIGMIKFMAQYGLNSGTSAAMVIARRAMNLTEKPPQCLVRPEDFTKHSWSVWNRVARFIKQHHIPRTQLFQWMKALEGILTLPIVGKAEHSPSLQVNIGTGESENPCQSPRGEVRPNGFVQLCLFS